MVNKRGRNKEEGRGERRRCEEGEEKHIERRELGLICEEVNIRGEEATHVSTSGFKQLTARESLELRLKTPFWC